MAPVMTVLRPRLSKLMVVPLSYFPRVMGWLMVVAVRGPGLGMVPVMVLVMGFLPYMLVASLPTLALFTIPGRLGSVSKSGAESTQCRPRPSSVGFRSQSDLPHLLLSRLTQRSHVHPVRVRPRVERSLR